MSYNVAVIGAGPAGLIAAETLAAHGHRVTIIERHASPGRKFLLAGRSGLNLTNSLPIEEFIERFGPSAERLAEFLDAVQRDPAAREWINHASKFRTVVSNVTHKNITP